MNKLKSTPVLYLDLDGTVRLGFDELGKFVNKKEDVIVFPEIPSILELYKKNGFRIIGISNQGGIALGHLTEKDCQESLFETYKQCNNLFDKIAYCKHHPDAKEKEMAICWCRKPAIGLIVETMSELGKWYPEYYPPHKALFVGDREEDKLCAKNANIEFIDAKKFKSLNKEEHLEIITQKSGE